MIFMEDSVKELSRFKFRKNIYSVFLIVGIILVTFGIISGMVMPNPLIFGNHMVLLGGGLLGVIIGFVLYLDEEVFAQKFDMTHLLDISDKDERYEAYMEHLSEWISSEMREENPILMRGVDPSGPDWGKTDFKLGQKPVRRDAIAEGQKYSGMEGDLTSTEIMVEGANKRYAKMAQKRWEIAESSDPDIIEYGVERLGDLVKTDYFEKNAKDGIFSDTAKIDKDSN